MPPRVLVVTPVLHAMNEYSARASGLDLGGFIMGRKFGPNGFLVTAVTAPRMGRRNIPDLGKPPKGAIGWFHARPGLARAPGWRDRRVHARLFPEKPALTAMLSGGEVRFYCGAGKSLETVPLIENLPSSPERAAVLAMVSDWGQEGAARPSSPDGGE